MRKKIVFAIFGIVVILCGLFLFYIYSVYAKSNFTTKNGARISIFISENTDFNDLMLQIEEKTTQKYASSFQRIAKYKGLPSKLNTGHYVIEDGDANRVVVNRFLAGFQSPVKLKFNNIRTFDDLVGKIDAQLMIDSAEIANAIYNGATIAELGFEPHTFISMFIPNTYEVYWNISAENLLDRMKTEYDKFWTANDRKAKAEKIGMTPIEVSSLASIVDGETNSRVEKPIVAGLYINRLKRGIPLQADPTVKFAVGDFSLTQILYKHLEIDSPYNTYKYAGLPPGPIAMPTISAIDAVLNHTKHAYIYMCAKETLDGTHNFAKTLLQHNYNAAKYHVALRTWKRKNK